MREGLKPVTGHVSVCDGGEGGAEGLKRTHALTDLCWLAVSGGGEDGGCAVLVITDGTPDSAEKVERVIIDATKSMRQDADLSISFIQVRSMWIANSTLRGATVS